MSFAIGLACGLFAFIGGGAQGRDYAVAAIVGGAGVVFVVTLFAFLFRPGGPYAIKTREHFHRPPQ